MCAFFCSSNQWHSQNFEMEGAKQNKNPNKTTIIYFIDIKKFKV